MTLLTLKKRVIDRPLPAVKIIDMKNEAMRDQRVLMHRHVKPLVKFILDTFSGISVS